MVGLCDLAVHGWHGRLPSPGEYVMSARGRTAYLIVEFLPARGGSKIVGRLRCERTARATVPTGAVVHPWVWTSR